MADFELALQKVLDDEGGYSNQASDLGGETLFGISRKANPDWAGWRTVDYMRNDPMFPGVVQNDPRLRNMAADLYRKQYWSKVDGDWVSDQRLAEILFSIGVNMSPKVAIRFLQDGLNFFSHGGMSYVLTVVDGLCGPLTRQASNNYLGDAVNKQDALDRLAWYVTGRWVSRYGEIVRIHPGQSKNAKGWLDRTRCFWT